MTTLPEPDQRYTTPPRQRIVTVECPSAPRIQRAERQDNINIIARPIVQQPRLSAALVGRGALGARRRLVFSFPGEFDCKLTPNCKPKKDHYRDDDNNNPPASGSTTVRCVM